MSRLARREVNNPALHSTGQGGTLLLGPRDADMLFGSAGIAVSSTPVAVNHATADVAIFLMIGALRQAYIPLTAIRAGECLSILLCAAQG